jgi:hypothetical protein
MGAVFRHNDFRRDYNKKILENAIKDLSPDTKDNDKIAEFMGRKRNDIKRKSDAIRRKAEGDPR